MTMQADLDSVLNDATRSGGVPGIVAALATREGIAYTGAAGRRGLEGEASMTQDTIFAIASMTKAITSVAAMQLVEEGRLALDQEARAVLPEIGALRVLDGFGEDGAPRLRPPRRSVTLRQLLTHTSGIGYDFLNADLLRYLKWSGLPPARSGKLAAFQAPLVADPGDAWEYGTGIDWVGRMLEAVTGQRLDRLLRDRVTGPLGMHDTGFTLTAEQLGRQAVTHRRDPDGTLRPLPSLPPPEMEFYPGGTRLYSTAGDYLRFLRMLLGDGALDGVRLLRPETVAEMGRNQIGELSVRALTAVIPNMTNAFDLLPGVPCKWGLGFLINTVPTATGRSAGSLAWAGINNTYYWIDPTRGVAGLLLAQVSPFLDAAVLDAFDRFETALYGVLS